MATYEYQPKSKRFYSEMKKTGLVYSEQQTTIVSNIQNYVRIFIYVNPHAPIYSIFGGKQGDLCDTYTIV